MGKHECRTGFWAEHSNWEGDEWDFFTNLKEFAQHYHDKDELPKDTYELFKYCPDCGKKLINGG